MRSRGFFIPVAIAEGASDTLQAARIGFERINGLVTFQAQPVVQAAQEEVAFRQQVVFRLLQDFLVMQRGQCFKCLAPAQCRSFVTMGELEHLRNKLDIHEPAAAFLQIEMGFIFAGQFANGCTSGSESA